MQSYVWSSKSDGVATIADSQETAVATVRAGSLRERAEAQIDGERWLYYRFKEKHTYNLVGEREGDREPCMKAIRKSYWRSDYEIEIGDTTYRVKPHGKLGIKYDVLRDGSVIGISKQAKWWTVRPKIELDASVPLQHVIFILWVIYIMRQREAAAAAAASA